MEIELPHGWEPRDYQLSLWSYLQGGGKRAMAVWHRRAGKDDLALNWTAVAAHQRVGNYWHMLPKAEQSRKAIWNAIDAATGKRRIDQAFPIELRESTRDSDMWIKFKSGSSWQVVGSDNYNSLVGAAPVGIVFSEWALADPMAWAYLSPILEANGGWALFITTLRGRNHATQFLSSAETEDDWYAERLTARNTAVFDEAQLGRIKRDLENQFGPDIGRMMFEQEYLCSAEGGMLGAYYASQILQAEQDDRICGVPYDPRSPVFTAWDIGVGDATAIWFMQQCGRELHWIDFYETAGQPLDHYAQIIRSKPYSYEDHLLPHDAGARELGTGKSIEEMLRHQLDARYGRVRVVPRESVDAGIQQVRMMLPRSWFDKSKCARGIEALRTYRADYDEERKVLGSKPVHDWSSHAADAARTLAMGLPRQIRERSSVKRPDIHQRTSWVA